MKSQVFTSSMIVISLITIVILFEYNQFYLFSKSKLPDYLVIDEMKDIAENHLSALQGLIGSKIYSENSPGHSTVYFESFLRNSYSPSSMLSQYESLLGKNEKGMKISYSFQGLDTDLTAGKSERNITGLGMSITHDYSNDLITFQNVTGIEAVKVSFILTGTMASFSSCSNDLSGKQFTVTGPGYSYERTVNNACSLTLFISNGPYNDIVTVRLDVSANNMTIDYSSLNDLNDVNVKAAFNSTYENLFKTASAYYNAGIRITKGLYGLNKSLD